MQKWIVPLNIVILFLIILALAKLAAGILSHRLTTLFPVTAAKTSISSPSPERADLLSFTPILGKGLFGPATQGQLTPLSTPTGTKQAATTSPTDLVLLGTARGSFRETFALIQKTSAQQERVFRLGDPVFDSGRLVSVQKDSVELLVGGQKVKLFTPTSPGSQAKPAAPQFTSAGLAMPVSAGSYIIDQRALNAALENIGQAMTDVRLLPSMKEGRVEGFRASEVKPAGIFGMVGIRNGDVLLRINDFPIDSPEKAIQSLASLKGQSRIKLDLIRDSQPVTFSYDIR